MAATAGLLLESAGSAAAARGFLLNQSPSATGFRTDREGGDEASWEMALMPLLEVRGGMAFGDASRLLKVIFSVCLGDSDNMEAIV